MVPVMLSSLELLLPNFPTTAAAIVGELRGCRIGFLTILDLTLPSHPTIVDILNLLYSIIEGAIMYY